MAAWTLAVVLVLFLVNVCAFFVTLVLGRRMYVERGSVPADIGLVQFAGRLGRDMWEDRWWVGRTAGGEGMRLMT